MNQSYTISMVTLSGISKVWVLLVSCPIPNTAGWETSS